MTFPNDPSYDDEDEAALHDDLKRQAELDHADLVRDTQNDRDDDLERKEKKDV